MSERVECVWPVGALLGEGPAWSMEDDTLWFVDIKGQQIHAWSEGNGATRSFATPEFAAFVMRDARGGLLCGLRSGLYRFDPDTGHFDLIQAVDAAHPGNRLNDGYVDSQGRLWFGTMDDGEIAATGSLYRFARGELLRPRQIPAVHRHQPAALDAPQRSRKAVRNASRADQAPAEAVAWLTGHSPGSGLTLNTWRK